MKETGQRTRLSAQEAWAGVPSATQDPETVSGDKCFSSVLTLPCPCSSHGVLLEEPRPAKI